MYTPVNPNFTILKWGLKGSKLYRFVLRDGIYNVADYIQFDID